MGCEGCKCSLQGSKARIDEGTFVQSSAGRWVPLTLREDASRTVANSETRYS